MKKLSILLFSLTLGSAAIAQEKRGEELKKEITKEVKMIEENGVKTLTIITTENGVVAEEVFTGAAADKKMAEIQKEEAKDSKKRDADKKIVHDRKMKMVQESGNGNM